LIDDVIDVKGCFGQSNNQRLIFAAEEQTDCAVYALNSLGDDISNAIDFAISNLACNSKLVEDSSCPVCAVQYMQRGLCLPGR